MAVKIKRALKCYFIIRRLFGLGYQFSGFLIEIPLAVKYGVYTAGLNYFPDSIPQVYCCEYRVCFLIQRAVFTSAASCFILCSNEIPAIRAEIPGYFNYSTLGVSLVFRCITGYTGTVNKGK